MVLGVAGWGVIVLFVAGLVLLGIEMFVLPGFGVAGVLGLLAVVASLVLGMVGPLPTPVDLLQAGAVVLTALVMCGIAVWQLLQRLPRDGRLQLRASTRREDGYVANTPRVDLVGKHGVAATDLHPSGTALFGEERVDVVSEGAFVPAGTPVQVVRAEGYRHVVRAVEGSGEPDGSAKS
jgi:membrane-bound serine protease (ClpP class)